MWLFNMKLSLNYAINYYPENLWHHSKIKKIQQKIHKKRKNIFIKSTVAARTFELDILLLRRLPNCWHSFEKVFHIFTFSENWKNGEIYLIFKFILHDLFRNCDIILTLSSTNKNNNNNKKILQKMWMSIKRQINNKKAKTKQ